MNAYAFLTVCVKPFPVLYGGLAFIALLRRLMLAIAGNFHIFIPSSKYESFHTFPVYSLFFIRTTPYEFLFLFNWFFVFSSCGFTIVVKTDQEEITR